MGCSCINTTFDFDLEQKSCSDIRYLDRSDWAKGNIYDAVPTYELKITLPGGTTQKHTVTVGESLHLDFGSCVEPGIYTFSTDSCDAGTFSKKVAITCSLWCGYQKAVAKIAQGIDKAFVRSIRENITYIEQLVAFGDTISARALTDVVKADLRKINCDCCY